MYLEVTVFVGHLSPSDDAVGDERQKFARGDAAAAEALGRVKVGGIPRGLVCVRCFKKRGREVKKSAMAGGRRASSTRDRAIEEEDGSAWQRVSLQTQPNAVTRTRKKQRKMKAYRLRRRPGDEPARRRPFRLLRRRETYGSQRLRARASTKNKTIEPTIKRPRNLGDDKTLHSKSTPIRNRLRTIPTQFRPDSVSAGPSATGTMCLGPSSSSYVSIAVAPALEASAAAFLSDTQHKRK
jgi:hypothetical protein